MSFWLKVFGRGFESHRLHHFYTSIILTHESPFNPGLFLFLSAAVPIDGSNIIEPACKNEGFRPQTAYGNVPTSTPERKQQNREVKPPKN